MPIDRPTDRQLPADPAGFPPSVRQSAPPACPACGRHHTKDIRDKDSISLSMSDCIRLHDVKRILVEGGDPYSSFLKISSKPPKVSVKSLSTKEVIKQRLQKFQNTVGKTSWRIVGEVDPSYTPPTSPLCIACHNPLVAILATYGRIVVDMVQKVIDTARVIEGVLTEVRTVVSFPVYSTGFCCKSCVDKLYEAKYYDNDGNLHRGIEILDQPINTTKETVTKGHRTITHVVPADRSSSAKSRDDNLPRGKTTVKSTALVVSDDGKEVVQWKTTPIREAKETIDGRAYDALHKADSRERHAFMKEARTP